MLEIRPALSAEPANWLFGYDVHWFHLLRFGPPVFERYVRIPFDALPAAGLNSGLPTAGEDEALLALTLALTTLSEHTTTPDTGYAAVWQGWIDTGSRLPTAPHVSIPDREMLLFSGPVAALADTPHIAWFGERGGRQEPDFVWPEDRAWCVACETDEELEFTVGCAPDVFQALDQTFENALRTAPYGAALPLE